MMKLSEKKPLLTYKQLIAHLYSRNLFGATKWGLENISKLDECLGHPHWRYKSIHIAGSNGKGSVATKIAATLEKAGYRVGLFTSPHIACFRERIRVNGKMIPETSIEKLLPRILKIAKHEEIPATFFEVATALAFEYFARKKVDFAVVETGLGGRLDATNILRPILTVITSISLEHDHILGPTVKEIAREKAGIIKPGVPVVVGPGANLLEVKEIALWNRCNYIDIAKKYRHFEDENKSIAHAALLQLKKHHIIPDDTIQQGLQVKPPCRFEDLPGEALPKQVEGTNPERVILDVAHNPEAFERLFKAVSKTYPDKPLRVIAGVSQKKDVHGCLATVLKHTRQVHLVEAPNGRGLPLQELKEALREKGVEPATASRSIGQTVHQALRQAAQNDEIVLVCGSFFIMSDVRDALGIKEPRDMTDTNERY